MKKQEVKHYIYTLEEDDKQAIRKVQNICQELFDNKRCIKNCSSCIAIDLCNAITGKGLSYIIDNLINTIDE